MVRLITGPGGAGKTRLAIEFAARLEPEGWRCGLLRAGRGGQAIRAIAAAGEPTLLAVDYAEACMDLEALLEALAAHEGEPVIRVLLLARTLGEWWQPDGPLRRHAAIRDVLADADAMALSPLTGNQETFKAALKTFAEHYDMPVPATALRPVEENTPVLLLHTAALTAVLNEREHTSTATSVAANDDVVAEMLGHEDNYWSHTSDAHGLDRLAVGPDTRRQMVAITGLLGADDREDAREVLRRLPVLADAPALTVDRLLSWLCELYPATSSSWLGPIQPDLLLESLVTSVFSASTELADAALTGLTENCAYRALALLARSLDRYPAFADPLLRRLLAGHADVLAIAAVHLARNLNDTAFNQLLADVLTHAQITDSVLTELAADLREITASLTVVTVAVHLRIGFGEVATGRLSNAIETAAMLDSIARQLEQSGSQSAEADASRAAATLYRAVEKTQPGHCRVDLAHALLSLGVTLTNLDEDQDACEVIAEAVELYRAAEKAEPGHYRGDLAHALTRLGVILSGLGRHQSARQITAEAVRLYRAAEKAQPGHYRADLASALTNLGVILSALGRHQSARQITAEAVRLYRAAEQAEPGRHRADLALALSQLAITLSDLGRDQSTREITAEAVRLYRAAEQAEPGRHRADLAHALVNLGVNLVKLGQHEDACEVEAEAVQLYRAAEFSQPGRHTLSLAWALHNLSVTLAKLGQHQDACQTAAEMVELYRAAEKAQAARYRTDLAHALTDFNLTLANLGQHRDAYAAGAEAVELYRAAEKAQPGHYRADLASALTELGGSLSNLGQEADARPAYLEAIKLYRAAEKAQPGHYRADLASALTKLGGILTNLGCPEQALTITGEAVRIYRMLVDTDRAANQRMLANVLIIRSGILLDLGRLNDAEDDRRQADLYCQPN